MKKFGWVITSIPCPEESALEQSEVGMTGPRNMTATEAEILAQGIPFRMYDDDGILYYEGKAIIIPGDYSYGEFMPLDNFGTPNAGCTEIRYLEEGEWKTV